MAWIFGIAKSLALDGDSRKFEQLCIDMMDERERVSSTASLSYASRYG